MTDTESNLGFGANQSLGGEQSSNVNSADDLQSTIDALNKRLDSLEQQNRALQSGKDRGINQVRKEQQALNAQFAEVKQYLDRYSDPVDAERFWQMDQFLKANAPQSTPQGQDFTNVQGQANPKPQESNESAKFIEQLGIDRNSPEYLANLGRGMSPEQAALAVLASKNAPQQEGVASGVSGGASGGTVGTTQEVLRSQYNAELDAAQAVRGYLTPDELYQIKEKYFKLGLQGVDY